MERLIEIAKKAGRIILNAHCESGDIENKAGEANFVTRYDKTVQNFLKGELTVLYPDAEFMGEESGEDEYKSAETLIVVDPIDGTTNFINNMRHSCVVIGIMKNAKPYRSVVYNPYDDEVFYAEAGKGAYLNGKRIFVSERHLCDGVVGFGSVPYYKELYDKTFDLVKSLMSSCADVRRLGSAALDLCFVACGRFELFFEYKLSLWDYCPAGLILTEAGGIIRGEGCKELAFDGSSAIIAGNRNAFDDFCKSFVF